MFDEDDMHLFPIFQRTETENITPIAEFIAKKIRALNASFRTSTDSDERQEKIQAMLLCSVSLSLLSLASYYESQKLIDAAKETFRGL